MTALVRPTLDLYDAWAAAVAEFDGGHIDGASLPDERARDVSREACAWLVEKTRRDADLSVPPPEDRVHADAYWITDGSADPAPDPAAVEVVGFIQLRHELTDFLREIGGHIGYSVRPSRRREGHAARALGLALDRARELGLGRVLITCDDGNPASYRTIERNGGVLQDVRDGSRWGYALVRRYWIEL